MRTATDITLDDKYSRDRGRVFLSRRQALVRLPLMQRARDQAAGLTPAATRRDERLRRWRAPEAATGRAA